ncbi:PLP-dependent aminotransferase family protein [Rhodospirillaceae bacterium SYSU D60014]|uniref:MocR-like ectoine utilization transcription factor EhuR n=1 Tax=Virgifigura deserti TaxID=2268457 RepID=UPI000E66F8A1
MTIWNPDLNGRAGPRYVAIADALAADIRAGRLGRGARLPTHRDLAYRLGVTVGTVSRAYAEAERRGLIGGEVGRGTFVRDGMAAVPSFTMLDHGSAEAADAGPVDLSLNFPARNEGDELLAVALSDLAGQPGIATLLDYQPHRGLPRHRAAGADWLKRAGLQLSPDQVVLTAGAQHAMMVVFSTLTRPGDLILTEAATYPGMKTLANLLHLRLQGLAMDEQGLRPDAFEAACRTASPRVLYCLPNIQNPTGSLMSEERRSAIARIAEAHQVAVVEDDVYGFLAEDAPPPLVTRLPQLGHYLTSVSKAMAPGLRVGFLAAPPGTEATFAAAVRTTTWMTTPLSTEIAARWIIDGTGDRLAQSRRTESIVRQEIARRILAGFDYAAHPAGFHGWLTLPEPWRSEEFTAQARLKGVLVTPSEAFAVSRPSPRAVRLCLSAARTRADLERGLHLLVDLLRTAPDAYLSIV